MWDQPRGLLGALGEDATTAARSGMARTWPRAWLGRGSTTGKTLLWENQRVQGGSWLGALPLAALPGVSSNPWLLLSFNASFKVLGNSVFFLAEMNEGF